MNPYDFARIDWTRPPERRKPNWHYQLVNQQKTLYSGSLDIDIYAETPIFIADPRNVSSNPREPAQSMYNAQKQHIIPGSSLKGMLRSVVETLGNGCLTLFDGSYERGRIDYTRQATNEFQHCAANTRLCIACRMFGMLKERQGGVFLGKVNIGDACSQPGRVYLYDALYTDVLVEPKPRHEAFYLDEKGTRIAGRKFYFHHSPDEKPRSVNGPKFMGGKPSNRYIQPLDRESGFHARLDFTALEADEFGVLLLAILLEDKMRHKIGYGKPLGLGSVELRPTRLTLVDYATRYTSAGRGKTVLEGQAMWDMLYEHTDTFTRDHLALLAMEDLRRIWSWPPEPGAAYYYPSKYEWFDTPASRGKRIKDTRNVPGAH